MAFKRRSEWGPAEEKLLEETLKSMATFDDLFGGGGDKAPYAPLKNEGDSVIGVIVEEPDPGVPVFDFSTKKRKFFVETSEGWKVKVDGEFDSATQNHRPVTKIVVTVETKDGQRYRVDFNTKQERDALKQEMQSTGLNLEPGVTLGKKVAQRVGNTKVIAVKLAQ